LKKEFVGSIVENYLLSGANDVKAWLPEDSPDTMVSPYTPATKTDGGLVKTVRGRHLSSRQELCR